MSGASGELPASSVHAGAGLAERILTAAVDECVAEGIKNTTIAAIAEHAGVTEHAVRARWGSVEDMVTAAVVRDLYFELGDMANALLSHQVLDDRIAEAFAAVLWFLDGHPLVGGVARSDAATILPSAQTSLSPLLGAAVALMTDGIDTLMRTGVGKSVDVVAFREVALRLTESLLLTGGRSTPLSSRADAVGYARRCVVPLVHALSSPVMP